MIASVEVSPMSFGCLISSTLPVASDTPCPKQTTRAGLRCSRAGVAQLAEHLTCNEDAVGSSPTSGLFVSDRRCLETGAPGWQLRTCPTSEVGHVCSGHYGREEGA